MKLFVTEKKIRSMAEEKAAEWDKNNRIYEDLDRLEKRLCEVEYKLASHIEQPTKVRRRRW